MTLPSANDDRSRPPEPEGEPRRPEWLTGMDEDIGQVPARPRPVTRVPVTPPRREIPEAHSKVDGLVRFEAPLVVQRIDVEREGRPDVDPKPVAASAGPPPAQGHAQDGSTPGPSAAWSAAASSIPAVRVSRQSTVHTEDAAPEEAWDEPEYSSARAASSTASAPAQSRTSAAGHTLSPVSSLLAWIRSVAVTPRGILAIAGVVVAVVLTAVILRPKERFLSIAHIKTHAQDLDGRSVNIKGTVGQTFPVGGGFAYYLHQSRDTIVVFTRNRTPVERTRVKLAGTVSTGLLDGVPRPAIFEDALLSK